MSAEFSKCSQNKKKMLLPKVVLKFREMSITASGKLPGEKKTRLKKVS